MKDIKRFKYALPINKIWQANLVMMPAL